MSMPYKKLEALAHSIIYQLNSDPDLIGINRLNKILWFADVLAYHTNGVSITGAKYIKSGNGVNVRHINSVIDVLATEQKIEILEPGKYGCIKYKGISKPETDLLSKDDCMCAGAAIDFICHNKSNVFSHMNFDHVLDYADDGEEIPLYATLVRIVHEQDNKATATV